MFVQRGEGIALLKPRQLKVALLTILFLLQEGKHYIPINTALLAKLGDPSVTAPSEETPTGPASHRESGGTW